MKIGLSYCFLILVSLQRILFLGFPSPSFSGLPGAFFSFFFFFVFLNQCLGYNSHTRQFFHSACTIQSFLAYPQICETVASVIARRFLFCFVFLPPQKKTVHPAAITPLPSHPPPSPVQPGISLSISPVWTAGGSDEQSGFFLSPTEGRVVWEALGPPALPSLCDLRPGHKSC